MFQGWRLKLREAQAACDQGRLEEATQQLRQANLDRYLPGQQLRTRIADRLADRAQKQFISGNCNAGWRDLEAAESLVGDSDALIAVRSQVVDLTLDDVRRYLAAEDPAAAIQRLESLEKRGLQGPEVRAAREVAKRLDSAQHLARRGKFREAQEQLDAVQQLDPTLGDLDARRAKLQAKADALKPLSEQLLSAMAVDQWEATARLAEQMLAIAPESAVALDAQRRAWERVGAPNPGGARRARQLADTQHFTTAMEGGVAVAEAEPTSLGRRFLLWVDAVGGYLVCMAPEVVLGQAVPGNAVHLPILGDISRRHAVIRREGEGYILDPLQPLRLNDAPLEGPRVLNDGDQFEMSGGVRLRFRQPHALSASARLDYVSRHRTQPWSDGILLMAESCVLGPGANNHVVCRDWAEDVVLFRQGGDLCCRAMESLEIDGRLCDGRGVVKANSHISGDDFAMSLEEL